MSKNWNQDETVKIIREINLYVGGGLTKALEEKLNAFWEEELSLLYT